MVEVFKTTVSDSFYAKLLIRRINARYPAHRVNFDLSDCDRILRIEAQEVINTDDIIGIIRRFGYHASVLPDEIGVLRLVSDLSSRAV
jgi:hypothetical protein